MLIRLNQPDLFKRRRKESLATVWAPLAEAVEASPHDLSNVRVTFDWLQYKNSFRAPYSPTRVIDALGKPLPGAGEIAIDLRQIDAATFSEGFGQAVQTLAE